MRAKYQCLTEEVMIQSVTSDTIRKYSPNLSDEELKKIQTFVYESCCGLMQYFYENEWEKDIDDPDLKKRED